MSIEPVRWVPIDLLAEPGAAGLTAHQRAEAMLMAVAETVLMETGRIFAGEDGWARWYEGHGGVVRYDDEMRACIPVANERHAWRGVASARLNVGRGSTLGPDTNRRTRWYDLELECGHAVQRTAKYRPLGDPERTDDGWRRRRTSADVLPAPKRVRCEFCQGIIDRAVPAGGSPRAVAAALRSVVTSPPESRATEGEGHD